MAIKYYDGKRIYLRPLELSDEPVLRRWVNDPENWRTLGRFNPINELREREYIEKLYTSKEEVGLGIALQDKDRLIGCAGLSGMSLTNRSAEFGVLIGDRAFQSRGFGTEATRLFLQLGFREYNLHRIELTVFAEHARAVRAYERAGFVYEGRAREAYYRGGRYVDVLRYALLRSEWESGRRSVDDRSTCDADDDGRNPGRMDRCDKEVASRSTPTRVAGRRSGGESPP